MVSVAFAMWLLSQTCGKASPCPSLMHRRILCSKPRANLQGGSMSLWLRYCIAIGGKGGRVSYDVNAIPSLSEPYGPDQAMADAGRVAAQIFQSGTAGHVRQAASAARGRGGTGLPPPPHLPP